VKALNRGILAMGVSAQLLGRLWGRGLRVGVLRVLVAAVVCAVLLCGVVLLAPRAALALEAQRWTLQDQAGRPWSLTLLEQADPAHPSGLRLRLTDRSGSQRLDHGRSLQLRDGLGGVWELDNRSGELVPAGEAMLPDGSAQFGLPRLEPRLRGELPLVLEVPLVSGDSARLMAPPAAVAALHAATGP
jgi:hypothetical protein